MSERAGDWREKNCKPKVANVNLHFSRFSKYLSLTYRAFKENH